MTHPAAGIAMVLSALLAGIGVLRAVQRRLDPPPSPELVRKVLHIGMGMVVLSFPWLFDHWWPVVALAAACIAVLLAVRFVPTLHARFGSVLGGVHRKSWGEIYYPLAVALLYVLVYLDGNGWSGNAGASGDARGPAIDPLLFCVPVLVLALADSVAAIVGTRFGRTRYTTLDGFKSVEGSVGFFLVTFASVLIPLLATGRAGAAQAVLIATVMGLLVMLMEAIAWRGLDNLVVPLGAFALLKIYLDFETEPLVARLIVMVLLVLFVVLWRWRSTLDDSALLSGALFGYACWALAGPAWLVPPAMLFILHGALWPRGPGNGDTHTVKAVASTVAPGLFWLFAYVVDRDERWLVPFTVVFAAHVSIIGVSWLSPRDFSLQSWLRVLWCVLRGCAAVIGVMLLLAALVGPTDPRYLVVAGWGCAAVAFGTLAFRFTLPMLVDRRTNAYRWMHQAGGVCAFVASVAVLVLLTMEGRS